MLPCSLAHATNGAPKPGYARHTDTPPCRACATTHRGVKHYCSRGHQGHPQVPTECPVAANRTPARVLGGRRVSQRTPMGRGGGGAERHTPAPKRRVLRTPTSGGPPRGVQRAQARQVEASGGTKDNGDTNPPPPPPESERPCKRARLRGRSVESVPQVCAPVLQFSGV